MQILALFSSLASLLAGILDGNLLFKEKVNALEQIQPCAGTSCYRDP